MNRTNGKIAEQSKRKIADSLIFVMERYSFKEITVTQLSQEAGLSRKTFYRLFDDKDAVLSYFYEKMYRECLERIKTSGIYRYWEVVECYFDFWEERKEILLLFKKHGLLTALFDGAYKYSFDIFLQIRSKEIVSEYSDISSRTVSEGYTVCCSNGQKMIWRYRRMCLSKISERHLRLRKYDSPIIPPKKKSYTAPIGRGGLCVMLH